LTSLDHTIREGTSVISGQAAHHPFTRAASSASGRAKNHIPISWALALDPTHQLVNLKYVFRD
jgi:hypothetical protein